MRECHETNERELLPLLLRWRLDPSDAARVRAHVTVCPACTAELAVLVRSLRLFDAATPTVNVAAIVGKLPAAPQRPQLRVSTGRARRPLVVPRYALAAAASLTLVATLSFAVLRERVFGPNGSSMPIAPDTSVPTQVVTAPDAVEPDAAFEPTPYVGAVGLEDLGAAELEALLSELDVLEATVSADPVSMQRPVVNAPEGL